MKKKKVYGWTLIFLILICFPAFQALADGGYFSSQSVAVSADQRAIIIQNGDDISMTFSTGYIGEGENFGWIIPTPVPPAIEDVSEDGEEGETAFQILDEYTAPEVYKRIGGGGCFPSGTEVLTADGPRAIETVVPGTKVYACDLATGEWVLKSVLKQLSHQYEGDMIGIQMGHITIRSTGNHPFFVLRGERLASRPLPPDVPKEEQVMSERGQWVEARDLKEGDVLHVRSVRGLAITSLLSRHEKAEVYNLTVEGCHNYAVHEKGILVHNKGAADDATKSAPEFLCTVYGRVILEHYDVSILGAADASALMNWLQENDYHVNPDARDVLDTYVNQNWAFVAVKLNPGEKRHYENEFLPPLTIRYQHGRLIFPLRISSVSTTQTAKITLYVIAESTVTSSNFPTTILQYEDYLSEWVVPEKYIEACIQRSMTEQGGGLSVMWSGKFAQSADEQKIINELMKVPFPEGKMRYLTRLETRMDPTTMTEDICLMLDPQPNEFQVSIELNAGWGSELILSTRDGEADTVRKLLEEGADVHAKDDRSLTALMWAFRRRYDDIVGMLLDAGADVNARDTDGWTTLLWAACEGHTDIVRTLLEAGADVNAQNEDGRTALMWASSGGHTKVLQLLLQEGADVNARNKYGRTALMWASSGGHTEVLQLLLQAGADIDAKNKYGQTALMWASSGGHTEVLQLLLQAGADIDAKNKYGQTALMWASSGGHTEVLQLLLQAGPDIDAKNKDGNTALMLARKKGYTSIVDLLRKAGAKE